MKNRYVVKRYYQYRLGNAPYSHDPREDKYFDDEGEALNYAQTADSGFWGDMRYRYEVEEVEAKTDNLNLALNECKEDEF
jgi:hypothetical protein